MPGCPAIPEEAYSAFSLRVHKRLIQDSVPLVGSLELSLACNLRCLHCYCGGSPQGSMSLDQYRSIIDQIADAGCIWLLVTGGEPLINPHFQDIYTYIKQKGILPTLFTNATRINRDIAEFLTEMRPFALEVSVYGASAKTYEKITGVKGSFDRCMAGISLLIDHGLRPTLKTMVMRDNVHELGQMHELAASLGLTFRFDPLLNPTLGGELEPTCHRIDPEAVIELDIAYEERIDAWGEFMAKFGTAQPSETLFNCGAGVHSFHIDPFGKLSMCLMARRETYDILSGSFEQGWRAIREMRMRRASSVYRCGKCSLRSLCGCCPAWAGLETGNYEGSVDYLCHVAALRAREFGGPEQKQAGMSLLKSRFI